MSRWKYCRWGRLVVSLLPQRQGVCSSQEQIAVSVATSRRHRDYATEECLPGAALQELRRHQSPWQATDLAHQGIDDTARLPTADPHRHDKAGSALNPYGDVAAARAALQAPFQWHGAVLASGRAFPDPHLADELPQDLLPGSALWSDLQCRHGISAGQQRGWIELSWAVLGGACSSQITPAFSGDRNG